MAKQPFKPLTLKELSAVLGLSQSTVSRIVNKEADKYRIARETQNRVLEVAAQHGYSANTVAKSLRLKRTHTIGVIVPEISEGYSTAVLGGIEDELLKDGFFYFVVSHRHRPDLLREYPRMLLARAVEGIIAVDTPGPTHLNFSVKTVTALIPIEWFGSPTQMISSRFAPQGASFSAGNFIRSFFAIRIEPRVWRQTAWHRILTSKTN
jgi:LacI family transcriptional regulator